MLTHVRSLIGSVPAVPDLLFPTIPAAPARRLALVPVVGTLIACWGTAYIRFGKTLPAIFVATLLLTLGISLLAGLRAAARAIAARFARGSDPDSRLDPSVLAFLVPAAMIGAIVGGPVLL